MHMALLAAPHAAAIDLNQPGTYLHWSFIEISLANLMLIAVHLVKIGGGKTYSQLAAASMAQPNNTALAGQVQTVFRGETLRGMLLNAYGFWKMGQIMFVGAIVAFVAAGVLLILSILGFVHRSRAPAESEVFPKMATRVEVNA